MLQLPRRRPELRGCPGRVGAVLRKEIVGVMLLLPMRG